MENVRTLVRGDDELIVALRRARRRLVGTLWLLIAGLLAAIMAYGLHAEWERARAGLTGAGLVLQMSHIVRWTVAIPAVLLMVLVIAERARTLSRLVTHGLAILLFVFLAGVGASLTLRFFIGTIPPSWAAFSFQAFNWFAYDVMVFAIIVAAGYVLYLRLAQMELAVRLDEAQSTLEEETMRSGLTIEQSLVLVEILRQIAVACARNPRRATRMIVDVGDLLRSLLAHLQRESVDLEDEVGLYELISEARGERGRLGVEVRERDDFDPVRPGSILVLLFRIDRIVEGLGRMELERERAGVRIRIEATTRDGAERALLEVPNASLAPDGRIEGFVPASSPHREQELDGPSLPSFLRPEGAGLIAVPLALGIVIGFASAVSRWIGVEFFVPNVEMSTSRIFLVELLEWVVWGLTGSLALFVARRAHWATRWVIAALALWLLAGHVGIAAVISVTFAPADQPWLTAGSVGYYVLESLREYDLGLRIAIVLIGVAIAMSITRAATLLDAATQERGVWEDQRLARIRALRAQLQPHFLLNSLHTIVPLLEDDPEEAARSVDHLAELLDRSHRLAMAVLVPLEEEKAMACHYLQAVSLRFGDRLRLDIDVPDDLGDVLVPALISQPLLENALVHGIERSSDASSLSLRVHESSGRLRLEIRNSTNGRRASSGRGIGIRNTVQALELCYGDDYGFESVEEEKQWVSRVDIPLRRLVPTSIPDPMLAMGVV